MQPLRTLSESQKREIALKIPAIINAKPEITTGELSEALGIGLEQVASILVGRLDYIELPVKVKDALGRKVDHRGNVSEE